MNEMMGEVSEQDPYLEVLQDIKDLMDARVGDKLKGQNQVPEEMPAEEPLEVEPKEDLGVSPEEMEELKKVYSR